MGHRRVVLIVPPPSPAPSLAMVTWFGLVLFFIHYIGTRDNTIHHPPSSTTICVNARWSCRAKAKVVCWCVGSTCACSRCSAWGRPCVCPRAPPAAPCRCPTAARSPPCPPTTTTNNDDTSAPHVVSSSSSSFSPRRGGWRTPRGICWATHTKRCSVSAQCGTSMAGARGFGAC